MYSHWGSSCSQTRVVFALVAGRTVSHGVDGLENTSSTASATNVDGLGGCGQSGFGSNAAAEGDRMIVAEGAHKPVFVVGGTGELDLTLS